MKIVVGSGNKDKVKIVENALKDLNLDVQVEGVKVDSGITDQPLDKKTTLKGSKNRARNAKKREPAVDFWFGLEGGLHDYGEGYHLVTFATLIDKKGDEFVGEGEEIHLPVEVSDKVKRGKWFGDVIREYAKDHEIDENLITRLAPFAQAIQNAYANYLVSKGNLDYRRGTIGMVMDDEDNFLIVQMIDYADTDWRFPGGGTDEGEKEEETILRELSEELGINKFEIIARSKHEIKYDWPDYVIANQIKKKNRYFRGQKQTQFLVKFNGNKDDIKINSTELKQIKWIKRSELKDHLHFKGQYEMAEKVLRELL